MTYKLARNVDMTPFTMTDRNYFQAENSLRHKHQATDGTCSCCHQPTSLEDKYLTSTGWVCGPCADELAEIETWGSAHLEEV